MASSQVELASSSSPFGCVLRDHNRRDHRYGRDSDVRSAAHAAFEKNLKVLVRDHLSTRISIPDDPDENYRPHCIKNHHPQIFHHHHHQIHNNNNNCINSKNKQNNRHVKEEELESPSSSKGMSPRRQARILDRWAARQARDMITTIERQSNEAELLALSNSHAVSSTTSKLFTRERDRDRDRDRKPSSPQQSSDASSLEILNLGASTLVRQWRDFEAEARLNHSNSFNSNSGAPANNPKPNNASPEQEQEQEQEREDGPEQEFEPSRGSEDEDRFSDWVSEGAVSRPASSQGRESEASESKRIRVADIIRRLMAARASLSSSLQSNENEQSDESFSFISSRERERLPRIAVNSPRLIRGRHAFNELLKQMEQDRQGELRGLAERRPVSNFPQRGRIQSLLRLRFLHREPAARQEHQSPIHSSPSWDRLQQNLSITRLRERFSTGAVHGDAIRREGNLNSPCRDVINNGAESEDPTASNQISDVVHHQKSVIDENQSFPSSKVQQHQGTCVPEDVHEGSSTSSDVTHQDTSSNFSNVESLEGPETPRSMDDWEVDEIAEEQDAIHFQHMDGSYDWFSDISRPQRDWEDQRQARYREMLDTTSDNGDIRQLLERRRVSSFLASDHRERMDQLMATHLERRTNQFACQAGEERVAGGEGEELGGGEQVVVEPEEEEEQLEFGENVEAEVGRERYAEEEMEEVEEEESDEDYNDEEDEGLTGQQYYNSSDYYDQTSSLQMHLPHLSRPWSQYHNFESGSSSDQVLSTSSNQAPLSQFFTHDNSQCSSCRNHPSIEMELIFDLKRHIEQLRNEMSELQRSMKSCMEMQVKLQHSMKREASNTGCNSVGGEGQQTSNNRPRKGSCCICYEMQVDSLLYRCGHMCTCLKCAHELQSSSRRCPICQDPIMDVVRAYAES